MIIKLRGLISYPMPSNDKWVYMDDEMTEILINHSKKFAYINNVKLDYETVTQYIGVKDRNGREIYVGDIVVWRHYMGTRIQPMDGYDKHIEDYESEVYQVIFQDGAFKLFSDIHGTRYLRIPQSELEVVGNIYEGSERLEKQNE